MFVLFFVLVTLVSAFASHKLAKKQGRPAVFWGVVGALFAPFTPFVLLFLKSKKGLDE